MVSQEWQDSDIPGRQWKALECPQATLADRSGEASGIVIPNLLGGCQHNGCASPTSDMYKAGKSFCRKRNDVWQRCSHAATGHVMLPPSGLEISTHTNFKLRASGHRSAPKLQLKQNQFQDSLVIYHDISPGSDHNEIDVQRL